MATSECFYQDLGSSKGSILCILDSTLALVALSPFVVGYWRGCWQLMDLYLFANNKLLSIYASFILGVAIELVFCVTQSQLTEIFDYKKRHQLFLLVSRLYSIIFAFGCVNHWRGVWAMWDYYTGVGWESSLISMMLGILSLIMARGLVNIGAPPFVFLTDAPKDFFEMPTMFSIKVSNHCNYRQFNSLTQR